MTTVIDTVSQSRAVTIPGQQLFEGSNYLRAATIPGQCLFENTKCGRLPWLTGSRSLSVATLNPESESEIKSIELRSRLNNIV